VIPKNSFTFAFRLLSRFLLSQSVDCDFLFQLNSWQPFKDQLDDVKVESFSIYAKKNLQKKSTTFPPGYQHIYSSIFEYKKKARRSSI
jgi:hypothetical protein